MSFKFLSEVFQSYQHAGRMILNDCMQWNSVYGVKIPPQMVFKPVF